MPSSKQQQISIQKATAILKKHGIVLSPENTQSVVALLYQLAEIFYQQHPDK